MKYVYPHSVPNFVPLGKLGQGSFETVTFPPLAGNRQFTLTPSPKRQVYQNHSHPPLPTLSLLTMQQDEDE